MGEPNHPEINKERLRPECTRNEGKVERSMSSLQRLAIVSQPDYDSHAVSHEQPEDNATKEDLLPIGWEARERFPDGKTYYVNHNTRKTTWTRPSYGPGSDGTYGASLNNGSSPYLPPGWEKREDPNGKNYFLDHNTRITLWVAPRPGVPESWSPLPPGWERRQNWTGRLYWVDHNTKTTSWDPPEHTPVRTVPLKSKQTSNATQQAEPEHIDDFLGFDCRDIVTRSETDDWEIVSKRH